MQLAKARITVKQVAIDLERVAQQALAVSGGQLLGGLEGDLVSALVGRISRILLKLHDEGRDQVERDVDRRKILEHRNHAPVVLQGVQAYPGHAVVILSQVLVKRLVHVPQEHEVGLGHLTASEGNSKPGRRNRGRSHPVSFPLDFLSH